jgi:hypothetical protein
MTTLADTRRNTFARSARPVLVGVGFAAMVMGGCSSSHQEAAYVHVDPGVGLITRSDSLGSFVSARVNTERREARARMSQPTAFTSVESQ